MALINCPNCGQQISDQSERCISCGYLLRERNMHYKYGDNSPRINYTDYHRQDPVDGMGITSLILGILALFAWILPLAGYPITVVGLILGIVSWTREYNGNNIVGVILCSLGLIATVINSILGVIMWSQIFSGF